MNQFLLKHKNYFTLETLIYIYYIKDYNKRLD